eukprot:363702-Chlamydomonas_euryale.AAC.4
MMRACAEAVGRARPARRAPGSGTEWYPAIEAGCAGRKPGAAAHGRGRPCGITPSPWWYCATAWKPPVCNTGPL